MGKSVNKAILLGHVGKSPESRSTNGGSLITTFSLATADRFKDEQGNWQERTEWHNLVAFNRTAEIVRDYVHKGSQLLIEGKIQTRSWEDRESGQKRYRTEIFVFDLTLLDSRPQEASRNGNANNYGYSNGSSHAQLQSAAEEYADQGITDQDIPF